MPITRDAPLEFTDIARIAAGEALTLAPAVWERLGSARAIVDAVVAGGIPAYGINTGVGALVDTAVDAGALAELSRNLLMSHACAVGEPLPGAWVRAMLAAQINNFAHGASGIAPQTVALMLALLETDCVPVVPRQGSVGYLAHMAHIALVLIGEGEAIHGGRRMPGAAALGAAGLAPVVLGAKEGLSLINGSPCATGLGGMALARAARLVAVADAVAAMSCVALGANPVAFDEAAMRLRACPGLARSACNLRGWLADGATAAGGRLQDALSLRAIPHVHGAARVALAHAAGVVNDELASVTDNPAVLGTPEAPRVLSQAHAVAPSLAMALDGAAVALAHLGMIAERRMDRLVNPLVSGLPKFLAGEAGVGSGFMIAQYSAAALVGENRRLAAPASLDGGVTSGLQEDYLANPTAAALKLLALVENVERIAGIELVAAAQALDLAGAAMPPAVARLHAAVRARVPVYADDQPLAPLLEEGARLVRDALPVGADQFF
ncbi:MAG: histidine ammonia-lyase [Proteobacteria bacterium]|nr:histidine ammonia-lyase [Pseudomonadota bacterium]